MEGLSREELLFLISGQRSTQKSALKIKHSVVFFKLHNVLLGTNANVYCYLLTGNNYLAISEGAEMFSRSFLICNGKQLQM